MQTILPPSGNTIKILGKARSAEHGLRWMHYVLAQPVEGGVLVFHTLTRALLLLTPEEYAAPDNLPELRDGWFRVPQEMDDITALKVPHAGCVECDTILANHDCRITKMCKQLLSHNLISIIRKGTL